MFINVRPRNVSHGFETFVPVHRAASLPEKLTEMTNNDINAWNFYRPIAAPGNSWDENLDVFNDIEKFPVSWFSSNPDLTRRADKSQPQTPCPGYYQNTAGHQGQRDDQNTNFNIQSIHQGQATALSCLEKRSTVLTNGYAQGHLGQRHGSFADFLSMRQGINASAYQNLNEPDLAPFTSTLPRGVQSSYQEGSLMIGGFFMDAGSPSTTYSGHSSTSTTVGAAPLIQATVHSSQRASTSGVWWQENSINGQGYYQDIHGLGLLHDDLPRSQKQQHQQHSDPWITGNSSSNDCSTQATEPITIPPKLTLNVPPASLSSSESSQGLILPYSGSSLASSPRLDTPDSATEPSPVAEQPISNRTLRRILPDSLPRCSIVPASQSNNFNSYQTLGRRLDSKFESRSRQKPSPSLQSRRLVNSDPSKKLKATPEKSLMPKKIEPKPANATSCKPSALSQSSPTAQAMHFRDVEDDFLVRSRLAGMSYKEIRRQGNFPEAESTLRGRFRTLTKHKAARVRRPEWTDNDVSTHF